MEMVLYLDDQHGTVLRCLGRSPRRAAAHIRGVAADIVTLFTRFGFFIAIYILIGVFHNTAPPHIPSTPGSLTLVHSWLLE
jgi:hypothetical protein